MSTRFKWLVGIFFGLIAAACLMAITGHPGFAIIFIILACLSTTGD